MRARKQDHPGDNILSLRLPDGIVDDLDLLVAIGVVVSRGAAARLLINEGIRANSPLFTKAREVSSKLSEIKASIAPEMAAITKETRGKRVKS
jgi:hypothetical protein